MFLVVPPGGCFPEGRRIELGPGALTIGRAEGCDIRVDLPGVDPAHAKISEVALIALGPDCAIGDVPLHPGSRRLVMPGDEIQIGSVVVALEGDDPSIPPPSVDRPVAPRLGSPHHEGLRVRVVEGPNFGDELLLEEEHHEYTIGRGPECDLVIEDREVSRAHVKLVRRGYSLFVQDLSSTRGSWLGRSAVYTGAAVEWSRPRMLRVGATVLSLELPEAIRRAGPGAQVSAPMTAPALRRDRSPGPPDAAPPPRALSARGSNAPTRGSNAPTPAPSEPPPGTAEAAAVGLAERSTRGLQPAAPPSAAFDPIAPGKAASRPTRKAWKTSGPTIGRGAGVLLLVVIALAILGALFVVFQLLE